VFVLEIENDKNILRLSHNGEIPGIDLRSRKDLLNTLEMSDDYQLQRYLANYRNNGTVEKWLNRIGEREFAKRLESFRNASNSQFLFAGTIVHEFLTQEKVGFEKIIGYVDLKKRLHDRIIVPARNRDLASNYGLHETVEYPLLYGPPGCGKTLISRALAGEMGKYFIAVQIFDVVKANGNLLGGCFDVGRKLGNSLIFLDEVEVLGFNRNEGGMEARILSNTLMTQLDGAEENKDLIVVGCTNSPWLIEPMLMRNGRFGGLYYVPCPDDAQRIALLDGYSRNMLLADDVDLEKISKQTRWYSCADLKQIVKQAASTAFVKATQKGKPIPVSQEMLSRAKAAVKPTTAEWFAQAKNVLATPEARERFAPMFEQVKEFSGNSQEKV
jgi:cell division protease FtsH